MRENTDLLSFALYFTKLILKIGVETAIGITKYSEEVLLNDTIKLCTNLAFHI